MGKSPRVEASAFVLNMKLSDGDGDCDGDVDDDGDGDLTFQRRQWIPAKSLSVS